MLSVLGGCEASDEQETVPESASSDINVVVEGTDNSSGSNETSRKESDGSESDNSGNNDAGADTEPEGKVLVAYFSRADENYGVGYIEKGNTAIIAEMIAEETGGELFHIERETPYPAVYDKCTDEAKQEQNDNARPALAEDKDISEYDVIFLGYPIWWGDMPMPVYTFLEGHDFSGKTVIPFCTHAGSGLSGTEKSIESVCTDAEILDGLSIKGEDAQNSQDKAKETVKEWLESLSY
ncbi:MAG: flavodoxin [Acetatifactor sp.]|nr:flavodoxin [Acetatifactor sp.]